MAEKSYREWSPSQPYLLPPSPSEWLAPGHLAYFIVEIVEELDLSAIEATIQSKDARGERPYNPAMMVALLLYSYSTGRYSSRRIARGTYEDVGLTFCSFFTCSLDSLLPTRDYRTVSGPRAACGPGLC